MKEQAAKARPFEELGREWLAGVEAGRISRRRGRGQPYSETTIADYRRSYRNALEPEFGAMVADGIGEIEWQMWVDRLSSEGLSRSRIASHVAVASAIYSWALTPSRRFVSRNPLRLVELPPNDEKPRLRAGGDTASGRAGPGRRAAIRDRVLRRVAPSGDRPARMARRPGRRQHRVAPARGPREERRRHGAPSADRGAAAHRPLGGVAPPGPPGSRRRRRGLGESGRLASRVSKAWTEAGLTRMTLDECRHTYASLLMAAGYTVKELLEYMGHADLQMVTRYVKLLPPPQRISVARSGRTPVARGTLRRALRCSQRSSSEAGISTSRLESTTFSSGCTLRSKWLRLIPIDAAASARVSAYLGTDCNGLVVARGMAQPSPWTISLTGVTDVDVPTLVHPPSTCSEPPSHAWLLPLPSSRRSCLSP